MPRSEYSHKIDNKSRIILPQKIREDMGLKKEGDKFIMTRGLEHCLFVYRTTEWEEFEKKALKFPLTNKNARRFERFFFGGAFEAEIDDQGRTVIPEYLRKYAGISKEIKSVGLPNRVEIWSMENWLANSGITDDYADDDLANDYNMFMTEINENDNK